MLFMIPWFVLMAVAILAVPIAAKMSPSASPAPSGDGEEAMMEDAEPMMDENFAVEPMAADPANPDDAFAEFG